MTRNADRWRQVEAIYYAALEMTAETRAAFLQQACAGDTELRSEVDSLLSSHDQAGDFLDAPALEVAAREIAEAGRTTIINATLPHYRIISSLGQGGMGRVYLAEDTRLRRKVALKLLDVALVASPQLRARFVREAQLASSLDHPNVCTVHEIGDAGGQPFIAMQFVEGKPLKQVIDGRPLALDSLLSLALQVADALAAAHEHGIVHRDVKSSNIIVTPRGRAKVLDFGLAKLVEEAGEMAGDLTQTGAVMGTPAYMSPEQARGERVDHRSDLFSFGVVLYEMATGRVPFKERSQPETLHAIIHEPHTPVRALNGDAPPALAAIIDRALEKRPEDRYASMRELIADLKPLARRASARSQSGDVPDGVLISFIPPRRQSLFGRIKQRLHLASLGRLRSPRAVLTIVVGLALVFAVWFYVHQKNRQWATAQVPRIAELAKAGRLFEAYDLALQARSILGDEPTISRLMPTISDTLSVTTEPAGAQVYLKRFPADGNGTGAAREPVGTSPIRDRQIARGDYLLIIEKPGFASIERTISGALISDGYSLLLPPPLRVEARLVAADQVPDRMAYVPGGDYRIIAPQRPTDVRVRLDDFLIDRFEVSNQEFKEFINAGGYLKKEYWKYPFVKDGKPLQWQEAMREFHDRTGLPGPRDWTNQNFAEGKAQHPITGITWYEAAAYAEFRGKRLPTLYEWEKAARNGMTSFSGLTMPWGVAGADTDLRVNFKREGTVPVDSFEFGMSPYGCYNMAGNVAEWCLNETAQGFFTAGGSWEDTLYVFNYYGILPGFYSSNKVGFRCVSHLANAAGGGAMRIEIANEAPRYTPAPDASVKQWLNLYAYDHTPLDAQVVEVTEAEAWRREKITFNGAGGERAIAYLYLPKNVGQRLQVIHVVPPADVSNRARSVPDALEITWMPLVRAGRALFAVVLKGYIEREPPANTTPPRPGTAEYREELVAKLTDLRRGLDYLETRADIDASRIAMFGPSGGDLKLMLPAIERRYRAVVYTGTGLRPEYMQLPPEINPINYVPHVAPPKLLVHGRYDEAVPLQSSAEPFFRLLREPKHRVIYEGSHIPGPQIFFPAVNNWLDETMGAAIHN